MNTTDPIADMLTRIRNANSAKFKTVDIPASKMKKSIAEILFNVALPRVRDFRGVSKNSFDGRGNYTMGIKEQLIFPEIEYDKIDKVRGMDIIFVTTAKTDEEARELLTLMGMPFKA